MQENQRRALITQADELYGEGKFAEAEVLYQDVLRDDPNNTDSLHSLFAIYMKTDRRQQAADYLGRLAQIYPDDPRYCTPLANALAERGEMDAALACYERLLDRRPELTDSRYNYARLLKVAGRLDDALAQYQQALDAGIARPEEVHTNMSVILSAQHRDDEARTRLETALSLNPRFVPALYNLGLLHEEYGRSAEAVKLFKRILRAEPNHADALARLAHGRALDEPVQPMIHRLRQALDAHEDNDARESLLYALGKIHDDCDRFNEAFEYYEKANALSRARAGRYDRSAQEARIAQVGDMAEALGDLEPVSDTRLVFVCGMFRSGSTLLEQMLAAHPALGSGGEIPYFRQVAPLPATREMSRSRLRELGTGYLDYLSRTFPPDARVIDKDPENFLYLGLICRMFPNARFINTRRHPLDNCLSIYFQPLIGHFSYANELLDIAHYYVQYLALMDRWHALFPANVVDVGYDELIGNPEAVLRSLLEFLGLPWDPACLDFNNNRTRVRTASVSQVRQTLSRMPRTRWRHYEDHLNETRAYLEVAAVTV